MARFEPLELVFDGIARQEPPRDAKSLVVHDKHFADRHAGRNGNPLQTFHVVSLSGRPLDSQLAARRAPLRRFPALTGNCDRRRRERSTSARVAMPDSANRYLRDESCGCSHRACDAVVVERRSYSNILLSDR